MRNLASSILVTILICISSLTVSEATIHVPDDQPTIQTGIDVAVDGDTVLVADADGLENINSVEIYSQGYPTGLVMSTGDSDYNLSYSTIPGSYYLSGRYENLPSGRYFVEIYASDIDGNSSNLWPYLTICD